MNLSAGSSFLLSFHILRVDVLVACSIKKAAYIPPLRCCVHLILINDAATLSGCIFEICEIKLTTWCLTVTSRFGKVSDEAFVDRR